MTARTLDQLDIMTLYTFLGGSPNRQKTTGGETYVECLNSGGHTHGDQNLNLRLNKAKDDWNCHCQKKGGGKLDLVILAGHAHDRSSASKWLVDQGLLAPLEREHPNDNTSYRPRQGDALGELAVLKRLPIEFLNELDLSNHRKGGINIPYRREDDTPARARWRRTPETSHSSIWDTKGNGSAGEIVPYGLWQLPHWRENGHKKLAIVEGETDSLTLWKYGYPALGVPGSNMYKKLLIQHFNEFDTLYIHKDAGSSGDMFVSDVSAHLRSIGYAGEIRMIRFGEHQDISALHISLGDGSSDYDFITAYEAFREASEIVSRAQIEQDQEAVVNPAKIQWKKPKERPLLHGDAYYGIVGDIVRLLSPYSEADPAAILFTLITCIGNIIGSDLHIEIEGAQHPPRLFTLIVGGSGTGRKGTSFTILKKLLQLIDPAWYQYSIKAGFASGEAVIAEYANKTATGEEGVETESVDPNSEEERGARLKKRLLLKETEFSRHIKTGGRDNSVLSEVIRTAWEEETLANRRSQEKIIATDVHLSILAHITPSELVAKLPKTDLENGYINRFVICLSKRPRKLTTREKANPKEIERLAGVIADRISRLRYAPISLSEEAWELYDKTYQARPDDDSMLGTLTVRAEVQVLRIAEVFAVLDGSNIVDVQHLVPAYRMWDYSVASFEFVFGDLTADPVQEKLMETLIDEYPQGLTKDELLQRAFARHCPGGVSEPIKALESAGRVRTEIEAPKLKEGTKGTARPATRVFAVPPPNDSEIPVVDHGEATLKSLNSLKFRDLNAGKSDETLTGTLKISDFNQGNDDVAIGITDQDGVLI